MPYMLVKEKGHRPYYWKICEVKGCKNCICLGVSAFYCFPHSGVKDNNLIEPMFVSKFVPFDEQDRLI